MLGKATLAGAKAPSTRGTAAHALPAQSKSSLVLGFANAVTNPFALSLSKGEPCVRGSTGSPRTDNVTVIMKSST